MKGKGYRTVLVTADGLRCEVDMDGRYRSTWIQRAILPPITVGNWKNETEYRSELLKALKQLPRSYWWKNNTGMKGGVSFGDKGSPDILGILPRGRMCGIETKVAGEKSKPHQLEWQRRAIELGALIIEAPMIPILDVLNRVISEI